MVVDKMVHVLISILEISRPEKETNVIFLPNFCIPYLPHTKQVFLRISSFCCFSLLKSAKVSIITPKMRFRMIMITMKKNNRS